MKPIIKVKNLSKQYIIGGKQEPYSTFRESLISTIKSPVNRLRQPKNDEENKIWALKDINFEVMPGEVVGIIGRNGAGKSTLLKVLSRITEPTSGKIELYGRIGSLLEVGTGFHPELTGRENIFLNGAILGMKREEITKKFDEIVDFSEIENFLDTPVKRYSSGMYTRLAFAVAAHLDLEVLLVDEVLAVGDLEFQKKCLGKMENVAQTGRTVLFVSHNMATVSTLCKKAVLLEKGEIRFEGRIDEAIQIYLNESSKWETYFDNKYIKYASVKHNDEKISIIVKYNKELFKQTPNLGFTISDALGNAVCGTNILHDQVKRDNNVTGFIAVKLNQPRLLNGTYRLSIWFGNGVDDFFSQRDCLTFDVVGMSDKQHNKLVDHGSTYPNCEWFFDTE